MALVEKRAIHFFKIEWVFLREQNNAVVKYQYSNDF